MRKWIFFSFIFITHHIWSQTDSTLSLTDCERIFLKNNLQLLAARYNVDAAQANVIQAKLWENPNLTVELNAYNPEQKKYFDIGSSGDKSFTVEQLIHLGGKKHNETGLAKTNSTIAQLEFSDLLRNLKLQLRESFFAIYYDNLSFQAINKQMQSLDLLIKEYDNQVKKDNIAMKDLIRLKSLYLDFRSKRSELFKNIAENQMNMALLIGKTSFKLQPLADETAKYRKNNLPAVDSLFDYAVHNRPDYLMAQKQVEASAWNLKWQKSLAIPDVTLGTNYSQRSGGFPNAWAVSVGIPIVLWNRNQGNIKAANAQLKSADAQKNYAEMQLMQQIVLSQKKWKEASQNFALISEKSMQDFKSVNDAMFLNFQHGNVSLIEFTDFLESYNQSLMQYHQFGKELINTCEEMNFYTYTTLF